jgi:hypothetical protein
MRNRLMKSSAKYFLLFVAMLACFGSELGAARNRGKKKVRMHAAELSSQNYQQHSGLPLEQADHSALFGAGDVALDDIEALDREIFELFKTRLLEAASLGKEVVGQLFESPLGQCIACTLVLGVFFHMCSSEYTDGQAYARSMKDVIDHCAHYLGFGCNPAPFVFVQNMDSFNIIAAVQSRVRDLKELHPAYFDNLKRTCSWGLNKNYFWLVGDSFVNAVASCDMLAVG